MGIRILLLICLALILLFSRSCTGGNASVTGNERPNILFIMSDDHAYQAISAYGHELNATPGIDRLAQEGAIFNSCYVTNSICAPSRAVILTGKHSHRNGVTVNLSRFDSDQPTFPGILRDAGYQTAIIGKWHLKSDPRGFDYYNVLPGQGRYYNPDFIENGEEKRYSGHVTELTTDLALNWLQHKRDNDKPFCLMYHQKAPHRNWEPELEYLNLFDDKDFQPPENYFDDYQGMGPAAMEAEMRIDKHARWGHDFKMLVDPDGNETGYQQRLERMDEHQLSKWLAAYSPKNQAMREADLSGRELSKWKFNRYIKDYLRCIQSVDDGVGEVLDYLDKTGLSRNTLVIYTSDQGFYLGEHGWFDKRFMYEESFRTPLLVRYPGEIKPGTVIDKLVQNLDFAPTILDYAGIDIPEEMQGRSFRKLARGKHRNWRDAIYYNYYEYPSAHMVKSHYGIRTGQYKLIHFYHDVDYWELYDLEKDPSELHNVYDAPDYAGIREMMHARLEELRTEYGDSDELNSTILSDFHKAREERIARRQARRE